MISTWKQFRLLLWKGLLIRRHSIAWSILELAIPVILFVFLASIRTRDFTEKKSNCHYDAKAFPSAGVLPFLNSYMCSFTNTCHKSPTTGDDKETINGPGSKESIIINGARVFADLMFRMGEHPKLYKDAFEELGKIIHKLAEGNSTSGNIIFRLASLRLLELYDKLDQEDWSSVTGLFKRLLTINDTNWMDMVTCGDNFDDLTAGSSDSEDDDGGEDDDELSEMKKKVINYVAKIAPAGDRDPSKSCEGIAVKANHTCTHMKAILVKQLEPLLIGRILVSPNIRIVRDLVDKLNEPLKMANLLVDSVKDFTQVSKRLQDSLANSDLAKAAKALLTLLETKPEAIPFPLRKLIRQMKPFLQHWFNPSSDSEAFFVTMDKVANVFLSYADCMDFDRFVIVENEPLLETQALCLTERNQYLSGLVFLNVTEKSEEFPPQIWYKIRHLSTLVDGTDAIIASRRVLLSRDQPLVDLKYLSFGFSFLQDAVERALIHARTQKTVQTGLYAQQEPYPCVNVDTFNVSMFLGLFVLLSWMIPSALLVKNIVHEKEMRLKEMMRIMGLGDAIHWLAWAFQAFMFNIFSIAFIALLLKFGKILPDTDLTILFVILILFALSCICQCILISTFFTRTNIAAVFTAMFFFLAFFPFQLSVKSKSAVFTHITLLFPQTAVGYGFLMLSQADTLGEATWATMDLIYLQEYNVRFGTVLASFGITSFLYYLMAWYISAVFPGTYGVGQRWYFFVTKRYWWPKMKDSTLTEDLVEERIHDSVSLKGSKESMFEEEPENLKLAVSIDGLNKVYKNKTKALDNLSVRFYEGQITAFLGHNGAGKTTTMSILTGLYKPTSGMCKVYGKSINTDMYTIRDFLGVCPQHNVLFEKLTVKEQLKFYGALKGLTGTKLIEEVEAMLIDTGLSLKKNSLAGALSGGMKRKLSIGIALIGGSKLIILDEPTAGIDAHARRSIWKLLLKNKEDRTMILSTHHMDEADVLADRIAIISEGHLVASGSSLFMKQRFGEGNRLVIAKDPKYITQELSRTEPETTPTTADETMQRTMCGERSLCGERSSKKLRKVRPPPNFYNKLVHFIREKTHGEGKFEEDLRGEIVFRIPLTMYAGDMKILFEALESRKEEFGIKSYGISAPSLQQIFLKIAPVHDLKLRKEGKNCFLALFDKIKGCFRKTNPAVGLTMDTTADDTELVTTEEQQQVAYDGELAHPAVELITSTPHLRTRQVRAIVTKRFHTSRRSWLSLFAELLLPIALLVALELYKKITSPLSYAEEMTVSEQELPMFNALYGNNTQQYFGIWDQTEGSPGMDYLNAMVENPGIGKRCMNPGPFSGNFQCDPGIATGSLNLDVNVSYNAPNLYCGCTDTHGWNCTSRNYPGIKDLFSESLFFNTTDRLWNLVNRNISQFRMTTYDWTKRRSGKFVLGGWTFGHHNHQSRDFDKLNETTSGVDIFINGLEKLSNMTNFNWEEATSNVSWISTKDSFNPSDIQSFRGLVKKSLPSWDVAENQKVWFNNRAWISLPLLTNNFYNAVYRSLIDKTNETATDVGITAINHPMNHTINSAFDSNATQKMVIFRILVLNLILSLIPASFAMTLIEERTSFSKHLQTVSGVPAWVYWMINFGYDFATYLICSVLIVLLYLALGVPMVISSAASFFSFLLLLVIYGVTAILLVYILQHLFAIPALGFVLIGIGLFFIGVVSSLAVVIIEQMMKTDKTLDLAHKVCAIVFLIIPQYNLGIAVLRLNMVYQTVEMGKKYLNEIGRPDMIDQMPVPDPLQWSLMGKHMVCLSVLAGIYVLVIFFMEYRFLVFTVFRKMERRRTQNLLVEKALSTEKLDDDVLAEQAKVSMIEKPEKYGLVVKDLTKSYSKKFLAVKGISFAVERGECFGLLGVNGAGKTTTFSMLTGRLPLGLGEAFIHGKKIADSKFSSFSLLGYCPQFDALNPKLTAREQLEFYSRIRGISEDQLEEVVDWAIREMQLTAYANEISSSYSGGNKRKLSAAIALVADPPVILLDEPSAGMDPSSQQFMWNLILQLRRSNRTTILTSHSMEECEALCTRLAIMVNGQFECLGGLQHLKTKFGKGYTLTMKLQSMDDLYNAKEFIQEHLPYACFEAAHCTTLFYRIDSSQCTISDVFDVVNKLQDVVLVNDYSLSQTTLDEVFVSFAAKSEEPSTPSQSGTPVGSTGNLALSEMQDTKEKTSSGETGTEVVADKV